MKIDLTEKEWVQVCGGLKCLIAQIGDIRPHDKKWLEEIDTIVNKIAKGVGI